MVNSDADARLRLLEDRYSESPIHQLLGLTLSLPGHGQATVAFAGGREFGNRGGNAAGGIISLLIDSAVVQACRSQLNHDGALSTVEFNVNFLRPVAADASLLAVGSTEFIGRTLAVGSARVHDSDHRLIAIGLVTVRVHEESTPTVPA
jgi:uncharacterized protein (TIGR00369 family)